MNKFLGRNKNGLISKITTYKHSNPELPTVVLFPMIHVGEKQFYEEIQWEMYCCDTVLLEGAEGPLAKIAAKAMRILVRFHHMQLSFQGNWQRKPLDTETDTNSKVEWSRKRPDHPLEKTVPVATLHNRECLRKYVRFVRADLDEAQSREALKTLPFWAWIIVPIAAFVAILSIRRRSRNLLIDGLLGASDQSWTENPNSAMGIIEDYIKTKRDQNLAEILTAEIDKNDGKVIGINYGAAHMPELHYLLYYKWGYRLHKERPVLAIAKNIDHVATAEDGYGVSKGKFAQMMGYVFKPKTHLMPQFSRKKKSPGMRIRLRRSICKFPVVYRDSSIKPRISFSWNSGVMKSLTPKLPLISEPDASQSL